MEIRPTPEPLEADQTRPADQHLALSWKALSSPATDTDTILLGDSLTASGPWPELLPGAHIVNRGVGGDTTQRTLNRLAGVERLPAKQAIVMLGIRDILYGNNLNQTAARYEQLIDRLRSSGKQVIVQSTLPVASWQPDSTRINREVTQLNELLRDYCQRNGVTYAPISIPDDKTNYTPDGIHLSRTAYLLWAQQLKPYF